MRRSFQFRLTDHFRGDMDRGDDALEARARAANFKKQQARHGFGTSQQAARRYLAAIEYQISELKDTRRIGGEGALGGMVSSGIEALERNVADVRDRIPALPDRYWA